jgi:hypothetical protein
MKFLLNALLSILLFVSACAPKAIKKQDTYKRELTIELGQTFKNDKVKIYLNKKVIYDKRVSSKDTLQYNGIVRIRLPRKAFLLTIEVNGKQIQQKSLKFKRDWHETEDTYSYNPGYGFLINYNEEKKEIKLDTLKYASFGFKDSWDRNRDLK